MKLYVGNLAFEMTELELRELFAPIGNVQEVAVIQDKVTQKSRGFGFVTMENEEDAAKAIRHLNGTDVKGRKLLINEARSRDGQSPRMQRAISWK